MTVSTRREKLDTLIQCRKEDEAAVLEEALRLGVDQLYRDEMRSAYLRDEITREQAIEILGIETVDKLDRAIRAVVADVEWGLRDE